MSEQGRPEVGVDQRIWDSSRIPRTYSAEADSQDTPVFETLTNSVNWRSFPTPHKIKNIEIPSHKCILWVNYWVRLLKTVGGTVDYMNFAAKLGGATIKSTFGNQPAGGASNGYFQEIGVFQNTTPTVAAMVSTAATDDGMVAIISGNGDPDGSSVSPKLFAWAPIGILAKRGTYDFEMGYATVGTPTIQAAQWRVYAKVERYD